MKRQATDPDMAWQPSEKMAWCKVCQVMHPGYYKCRAKREVKK